MNATAQRRDSSHYAIRTIRFTKVQGPCSVVHTDINPLPVNSCVQSLGISFAHYLFAPPPGTLRRIPKKGDPLKSPALLTTHGKPCLKGRMPRHRPQIRGMGSWERDRKKFQILPKGAADALPAAFGQWTKDERDKPPDHHDPPVSSCGRPRATADDHLLMGITQREAIRPPRP